MQLSSLFGRVFPQAEIVVSSYEVAELVKYATNAFLALKVTFSNQMFDLCKSAGLPYEEFQQILALDPRVGTSHLDVPGPDGNRGYGGSCLPKDMSALRAYAAELGVELPLLDSVNHYNNIIYPGIDQEGTL